MLLHDWYLGLKTGCVVPSYVIESKLTSRAYRLYCIYAAICQEGNGICWDSISSLCNKSGLSRQGVIDCRRELEHFGFIEVRRPKPMFGPDVKIQVSLRHPDGAPVAPWMKARPESPYEDRQHGLRRSKKKT